MHLNPGLVQGLPRFYEKYIAEDLDNQIWLVTHSDRFLREALDTEGMAIYHMQHATAGTHSNQLQKLDRGSNLEAILIDLVGDLASYRPEGKTVLLEGENGRFDEKMVRRLFPELAKRVNFVSAGTKSNVQKLQDMVASMKEKGQIQGEVWSIIDPDEEIVESRTAEKRPNKRMGRVPYRKLFAGTRVYSEGITNDRFRMRKIELGKGCRMAS